MAISPHTTNAVASGARWKGRLLAVGAAVVAALVVFVLLKVFGQELRTPGMNGAAAAQLNAGAVVLVSALAGFAAWALLAVLERFTEKALMIWTIVAVAVLVLSLGGPMSGTGVSTGNRLALALMHVVAGTVLIVLMRRTAGRRRSDAS